VTSILFKRLTVVMPVVSALAIVVGSEASVMGADCMGQLGACYQDAANAGGFWESWAAGLDCEASYTGCVRAAYEF